MKLVRNFLSLAAAEAISKVVTLAAFAYLARVAGPDGFGYVEFAGAVLLCAGLVIDQGFGPYGAREIAKCPERTSTLVSEIVLVRFILAVAAYAAMLALVLLINFSPIVSRLLFFYGMSLLVLPLLLQWVFQGHELMRVVGAAQIIRQTVFAVAVFAVVRTQQQIWLVALAELAAVSSAAAFSVLMYWRLVKGDICLRPRITGRLFREGVPIGFSQMFWLVKMYGATLVLGAIASPEDVGFFAASMRILIALHTFVYLYYFNLLPSLARGWQAADGSFNDVIDRSLHGVAWMAAAAGVLWVIVAPIAMTAVYGQSFEPAGSTLQWLAGMCIVGLLSGHYRFGLIAAGHQNAEMLTSAAGAVAAAVLIPIGYSKRGPEGAAIALVLADVTVWASSWWFGRRLLGLNAHGRLLIGPVFAALFVSGLLWLLPIYLWGVRAFAASIAITALASLDPAVRNQFRKIIAGRQGAGQLFSKQLPEVTR